MPLMILDVTLAVFSKSVEHVRSIGGEYQIRGCSMVGLEEEWLTQRGQVYIDQHSTNSALRKSYSVVKSVSEIYLVNIVAPID